MDSGILLTLLLFTCTTAQRPFFAGSIPKDVPNEAPRFKVTLVQSSSDTDGLGIADRAASGDNDDYGVTQDLPKPDEQIPIDARGDVNLVHRLKSWPKENRPFWLLNARHIERSRNTPEINQSTVIRDQQNVKLDDSQNEAVSKQMQVGFDTRLRNRNGETAISRHDCD